MKANRKATKEEVANLIKKVDRNADNKVNKEELLDIFKKVILKWMLSYHLLL